uniref:hypothetical protein n=1 Tax=Flavobacterium sp. TaxID=239 RepID=UPI0040493471
MKNFSNLKYCYFLLLVCSFIYAQGEKEISKQTGDLFGSYMEQGLAKNKSNTDSISYEDAYLKLKNAYLLLNRSESFVKYDNLIKQFVSKLNITSKKFNEIKKAKTIMTWVRENIEKTKFESVQEADEFNEMVMKADLVHYQENQAFYVLQFELVDKFGGKILSDVMMDYYYAHESLD